MVQEVYETKHEGPARRSTTMVLSYRSWAHERLSLEAITAPTCYGSATMSSAAPTDITVPSEGLGRDKSLPQSDDKVPRPVTWNGGDDISARASSGTMSPLEGSRTPSPSSINVERDVLGMGYHASRDLSPPEVSQSLPIVDGRRSKRLALKDILHRHRRDRGAKAPVRRGQHNSTKQRPVEIHHDNNNPVHDPPHRKPDRKIESRGKSYYLNPENPKID